MTSYTGMEESEKHNGHVELNPGPVTPNQSSTLSTNYPCGICQKKVKDSHHAQSSLCDKCELWFHTDYVEFPISNYSTLLALFGFVQTVDTLIIHNYTQGERLQHFAVIL